MKPSKAKMESKMNNLETRLAEFGKIVSIEFCNDLAKRTGFVQRSTSQIQGYEFAQAMMIPNGFLDAETLNSLASRMKKINPLCNISASALAQRINTKSAKEFMKTAFGKLLKNVISQDFTGTSDLKNLSGFNRILIEDSTKAQLHERLSDAFKGTGGSASKSQIKIEYIFDYLSEQFVHMKFCSGNIPDQSLGDLIIPILEKDDLVLADLGYYSLKRIKAIDNASAYYISRLKSDVNVYRTPGARRPLDLPKFLEDHIVNGLVDVQVYIGAEKYPVRLIACVLNEEALNKRNKIADKAAKKRGKRIGKKKLGLLKFCVFITNIPNEILSSIPIMATYRARWRVELIFKQWKSCLKLHIFKGFNEERFYCFLYGRLIMILLQALISPPLMQYAITHRRELSHFKFTKYIISDNALLQAILEGKMSEFIETIIADTLKRLCMDKRNRFSLRENVRQGNSYYKELEMIGLYFNAA